MAIEIKAPEDFTKYLKTFTTIFLGGSIAMGAAEDWQAKVVEDFKDYDNVVLLNPRRDNWDSSWAQSIKNPKFKEQVDWELDGLEVADYILIYFDPATESPVSMLELGLFHKSKMIVVCPEGFWRKGNVDIVCDRYKILMSASLNEAVSKLKKQFTY